MFDAAVISSCTTLNPVSTKLTDPNSTKKPMSLQVDLEHSSLASQLCVAALHFALLEFTQLPLFGLCSVTIVAASVSNFSRVTFTTIHLKSDQYER